ncbi:MAG: protein phosphatase 2C domain-containing protein [Desulfuromonadales bacterium]
MTSAHATHPGQVQQNNEDSIRTDDSLGIYLLADGMGGHNSGEVASTLAVDVVYMGLKQSIATTPDDGLFDLMANTMQSAHWEINQKARTSLSYMGMGTTLVVAVVREDTSYIAHAGDSRAYHFQTQPHPYPSPPSFGSALVRLEKEGTYLQRLTNDHTMGDQLLANGVPREQIPERQFHTLTQSIGCGDAPIPDFNTVELSQGDMLLLCSDGLTDMLTDTGTNSESSMQAHQTAGRHYTGDGPGSKRNAGGEGL